MKYYAIYPALGAILAVSACTDKSKTTNQSEPDVAAEVETQPIETTTETLTYGDKYYVADFWAGEYPTGFAVAEDGVVVQARAQMHIDAPKDVSCPLSRNANYHTWNAARVETDELKFHSVIETSLITITSDIKVEVSRQDVDELIELDLNVGDTLTYLSYVGEGFIIAAYEGHQYFFNEGDFIDAAEFERVNSTPEQWVQVKCADDAGTRGWILHRDTEAEPGLVIATMAGYGEAYDLDHEKMVNAFTP